MMELVGTNRMTKSYLDKTNNKVISETNIMYLETYGVLPKKKTLESVKRKHGFPRHRH